MKKNREAMYSQEFQALLDRLEEEDNQNIEYEEEEEEGEMENVSRRRTRRKLSIDQAKALERKFEAETRLGQQRKTAIAKELGLEPRQVAVWFQNRRARCKSKLLEKEFSRLQGVYDTLRRDYDSLERETKSLLAEVRELEAKNEAKESNMNVVQPTSALVSPWWTSEEDYVASSSSSTWDVFNSFDQTYFW